MHLGAPKERLIVVALALHVGRPVSVHRLVDVIWGEEPPESAVSTVRVLVSRLRRKFADLGCPDIIVTQNPGYVMASSVAVDVDRFELLAAQGRAQLATANPQASATLAAALAVWTGAEMAEGGNAGLASEAVRLQELRLSTLEARIQADLADGRHAELVSELAQLCERHPTRERLWVQLMLALYRCGRQADALRTYQRLRTALVQDLGLEPGPEVRRLETAILSQDASLEWAGSTTVAVHQEVPRQLRLPTSLFVGQAAPLARLDDLLREWEANVAMPAVCTISGTAGVGKTTLALEWAQRNAHRFPDGQLYADLHGFDVKGAFTEPADVLRAFLDALHVPADRMPAGLEAQAALYRTATSGKRLLVMLDNARDSQHVHGLLPGSASIFVIVTSRDQMASLAASEGAVSIALRVPPVAEALGIFSRRVGSRPINVEEDAAHRIIEACGFLPLALAVAAARANLSPDVSLDAIAAELEDRAQRLNTLTLGDPERDVRSVLSWSYDTLTTQAATIFRLLGLHPGPEISVASVASLAGWPTQHARQVLTDLCRASMLTEHRPGRYVMHDLLHEYALEQASTQSDVAREEATRRLLDHYLQATSGAARLLRPTHAPGTEDRAELDVPAEGIVDRDRALAWLNEERPVLLRMVNSAARDGFHDIAYQLTKSLADYLERQGHWHDMAYAWHIALNAAAVLRDWPRQAYAHRQLATAHTYLDDLDTAETHLRDALELADAEHDLISQAHCHLDRSWLADRRGAYATALEHAEKALKLYQSLNHRPGSAHSLNAMGWFLMETGDVRAGSKLCQQALSMYQADHDRDGEADAFDNLAYGHQRLHQYTQAIDFYRKAIAIYRALNVRYDAAVALQALGETLQAVGDAPAARTAWEEALIEYAYLQHPGADTITTNLRNLKESGGA